MAASKRPTNQCGTVKPNMDSEDSGRHSLVSSYLFLTLAMESLEKVRMPDSQRRVNQRFHSEEQAAAIRVEGRWCERPSV